jgi:hypothetical protein
MPLAPVSDRFRFVFESLENGNIPHPRVEVFSSEYHGSFTCSMTPKEKPWKKSLFHCEFFNNALLITGGFPKPRKHARNPRNIPETSETGSGPISARNPGTMTGKIPGTTKTCQEHYQNLGNMPGAFLKPRKNARSIPGTT